jgi:CubicO group peptidase (beta-lactamase class C family)
LRFPRSKTLGIEVVKRAILALTTAVLLARVSAAAPTHDALAALTSKLEHIRVESEVPGMAVAMASHGKIVYEKGFGWANREARVPATEETMFSLASVSKPFTATGVMTLVQSGKLDLDRPVNDYLGDVKLQPRVGDAAQATVRRVANHSAGLPWHYEYHFDNPGYLVPTLEETILHYGNLVTAPGERYQYSNLGYGVLGYVISRISGMEFSSYMRQEVFLKLGLERTSVGIGPGLEQFAAVRYDVDGAPLAYYRPDTPGAGGIYSSAHDVVRFGMFHLKDHLSDQQAILSDASLEEMHRPTMKAEQTPPSGYGVGWVTVEHPEGYRAVTHSGGMLGVATDLILIPAEDLAVVVLTNGNGKGVAAAEDLLVQAILPKWKGIPDAPDIDPAPFKSPAELLGVWTGYIHTYVGDRSASVSFLADGHVLFSVGDQVASVVKEAQWVDHSFRGIARAELNTPDLTRHEPYNLELNLQLRGSELTGSVTAVGIEGVRSARPFALTHWTQLKKTSR